MNIKLAVINSRYGLLQSAGYIVKLKPEFFVDAGYHYVGYIVKWVGEGLYVDVVTVAYLKNIEWQCFGIAHCVGYNGGVIIEIYVGGVVDSGAYRQVVFFMHGKHNKAFAGTWVGGAVNYAQGIKRPGKDTVA